MAVLPPLGDLIYMQKKEESSLEFLRVLARLKKPISFPMVIIVNVGVRSFKVLLEDSGIQVIRSKVVQGPVIQPTSSPPDPVRNSSASNLDMEVPRRSTHQVEKVLKGKLLERTITEV